MKVKIFVLFLWERNYQPQGNNKWRSNWTKAYSTKGSDIRQKIPLGYSRVKKPTEDENNTDQQ